MGQTLGLLKRVSSLTGSPLVYRMWQAPFVQDKFAPVKRHNDLTSIRRVLDVGCGPGTNAPLFRHTDYVGVDLSQQYIESARRRHCGRFIAADVRNIHVLEGEQFDFILVNSLFHHIETADVAPVLERLHDLLSPDGHIHILDLVLPKRRSISRMLALLDRATFRENSTTGWRFSPASSSRSLPSLIV